MKRLSVDLSNVDRIGASLSFACAIHCAIVPFAATILPLLGVGFLADKRVEHTIILVSIALASVSVCWGFRRHRQRRIFILFGTAGFLILSGRGFLEGTSEVVTVVLGATLFVCGHLLNYRLCHACQRCEEPEKSAVHIAESSVHLEIVADQVLPK